MPSIIKSSSGFLFSEDKWDDLSLLWDLSPNDPSRVALTSDSISLLPGDGRLELLIPVPDENGYIVQSEIEYTPTKSTEKAGCLLKSVTDSNIELEICGDSTLNCKYTKMIISNDYILNAKASYNGNLWTDYGNTKVANMNNIGYYIDSNAESESVLKIKSCVMYKNNDVVLQGFDRKNTMKLFDRNMNEITDKFYIKKKNTQMILDGTNIMFPIDYLKIQVSDRDTGEVYHEGEFTNIYGGDTFEYNYKIDLFVDEHLLDGNMYDLGKVGTSRIYDVKIINKESYPLKDKKIRISYYSVYNRGNKLAKIALENSEDYKDELTVTFNPGEAKRFRLKISRGQNFINMEDEYKFNIILE